MAEPIGLASGLLTLAIFALQSSVTLYNTIKSYQSHPKRVRDLLEELEALSGVLGPLTETIESATDVDLSLLDLPLLRCGNACKDLEHELQKCSSRSGSDRTSFRDWAKLKYMGDDIDGFRNLLAGYKATINVALADANLRKSCVNTETLESYKSLIETATEDLQTHLESIDQKLNVLVGRTLSAAGPGAPEIRLIEEERSSTQRCLQICEQLSHHISEMQLTATLRAESSAEAESNTYSERVTRESLEACKESLTHTAARLEKHMRDLMNRMTNKAKNALTTEDEIMDLTRLQEQWEAARQCIDVCGKADQHLKENVSTIENYGTGDAVQFMVSTNGKVIHGKNKGLGWRSRQVGGYLSDTAVIQLSRDLSTTSIRVTGRDEPSSRTDAPPGDSVDDGKVSDFKERYGEGVRLAPQDFPNVVKHPAGQKEGERSVLPRR